MTTKEAGERKRTVTVVVGPRTVVLMDRVNARLAARLPWMADQTLTALTGAALDYALAEWRYLELPDGAKQPWSHYW